MDASEIHARRLNAQEVLTPMKGDNFIFPVADGTVKIYGGDQRLRTSSLIRDRPERGEEQEILQGKSYDLRSPTPRQEDSMRDGEEARNDFWTEQENSSVAITWNPESNCTYQEKNHFLFR